ncbi:MAG: PD-(D/E)XK nuclease family protein [Candidatus Heimdallarchaeota archaeon]|nr:PD-(D/E)XK nuclease family protein [Candidatus Heimdallarchaeota archaeon]
MTKKEFKKEETTKEEQTPETNHAPKVRNLSPTKIADQFWCEMQLHFRLLLGMEPTEVMIAGADIHRSLEEELGPVVEVSVETRDDELITFILQQYLKLKMLKDYGLTRELPVLGVLSGFPVIGIIDQLEIIEVGNEKRLLITDYKTRKSKRAPSYEQKRRNNIQLQVYWYTLHNLLTGKFTREMFKEFLGIEEKLKPSTELLKQLPENLTELLTEKTPEELLKENFKLLKQLPKLSDELQAIYLHQKDRTIVYVERTFFHEESFETDMEWAMGYWEGKREPNRSPQKWMCKFCQFTDKCEYYLRDYLKEKEG